MVAERVIRVIAATVKIPLEQITPQSTFAELGLDSLDGLNILYALEAEFHVSIPNDRIGSVTGVSQVIDRLQAQLAGQVGAGAPAPEGA